MAGGCKRAKKTQRGQAEHCRPCPAPAQKGGIIPAGLLMALARGPGGNVGDGPH